MLRFGGSSGFATVEELVVSECDTRTRVEKEIHGKVGVVQQLETI